MVQLESYNKLREEIISLIGDNLLEDDEPFLSLISNSKDSKGVLRLAKDLKEEGNTYFKKGEIDDALEKYGYAVMIVARYEFVEGDDRVEFFKLAICILMNSTLCFSKKREFVQVGRICSIVLEFDENNVKAMFRRAMAAVELGKKDWAKLDLLMAANIDPNNKEVIKKLEELKHKSNKQTSSNRAYDDIPIGLGIGLSSLKKKAKERLEVEHLLQQIDSQENNPNAIKEGSSEASDIRAEEQQELGGDMESQSESTEIENISSEGNNIKDVIENVEDDKDVKEMEEDVRGVSSKDTNLAEPKYRFANRRRPGSSLTISRKDYQELIKGKSIYCVNSRIGSPMTIRLVMKEAKQEVQMANSTSVDQSALSNVSNMKMASRSQQKGDSAMEAIVAEKKAKEESEAGTTKDSQHSNDFESSSSGFSFQSAPSVKSGQKPKVEARKRIMKSRFNEPSARKKQNTSAMATNPFATCRCQVGMKRKLVVQHSELAERPRKHHLVESSCSIKSSASNVWSSFSLLESCSNNVSELQGNMQGSLDGQYVSAVMAR